MSTTVTPRGDVEVIRATAEQKRLDREQHVQLDLHVAREKGQIARDKRLADVELREARRGAREKARKRRRSERRTRHAEQINRLRDNGDAIWANVVYILAVGTAAGGQVSAALSLGWHAAAGIGVAGFVEGYALACALTARKARLRGERALAPRFMTWVAAAGASAINVTAHWDYLLAAVIFGAASVFGIVMWEIRAELRTRDALRAIGKVREPAPKLGVLYWMRYPGRAFWAWSACIADPSITTRQEAIDAGSALRARRAEVKRAAEAGSEEAETARLSPATDPDAPPQRESAAGVPGDGTRPDATVTSLTGRERTLAASARSRQHDAALAENAARAFIAERLDEPGGALPTGAEVAAHCGRSANWGIGIVSAVRRERAGKTG